MLNHKMDSQKYTIEIVVAFLAHNAAVAAELPDLIMSVHTTLAKLGRDQFSESIKAPMPPLPISDSVTPDYLICLETGLRLRLLKFHLKRLGLTQEQYRAKWGLSSDYPMVAPNLSARRRALAKSTGLGRIRKVGAKQRQRASLVDQ